MKQRWELYQDYDVEAIKKELRSDILAEYLDADELRPSDQPWDVVKLVSDRYFEDRIYPDLKSKKTTLWQILKRHSKQFHPRSPNWYMDGTPRKAMHVSKGLKSHGEKVEVECQPGTHEFTDFVFVPGYCHFKVEFNGEIHEFADFDLAVYVPGGTISIILEKKKQVLKWK